MKKIFAILLSVILVSSFSSVYAQEQITGPFLYEQLSPSGLVLVKLEWPEVYPEEVSNFKVSFHDPETGELVDDIKIHYQIYVTQNDHEIETIKYVDTSDGTAEHEILFPSESEGLAKVIVRSMVSIDEHAYVVNYHENVEFSVNVVPEFGVIAMIILSIAFVPILLLSKSKLVPKF